MITISFEAVDGKYLDHNAESFKRAAARYFREVFDYGTDVTTEEYVQSLTERIPSSKVIYKRRKIGKDKEENAIYAVTVDDEELTMFLLQYAA